MVDRNLESCVEELRADVVSGKSQVVLTDVEAMVLALGHIGRSLASLRGQWSQPNRLLLIDTRPPLAAGKYVLNSFLHLVSTKCLF